MLKFCSVRLFVSALTLTCYGIGAQASCDEKKGFEQANVYIQPALSAGRSLTQSQMRGLDEALNGISFESVSQSLSQNKMSIYSGYLQDIFTDIAILQRTGSLQNTGLSLQSLNWAKQLFEQLCAAEQDNPLLRPEPQLQHRLGAITFSFSKLMNIGDAADVRSYFNLSLVFFLLLGLISLIAFVWKLHAIAKRFLASELALEIGRMLRLDKLRV